jgi:hypothetical protein
MTAAEFLATFLDPGLEWMSGVLGPVPAVNDPARLFLLVAALQETGARNIAQEGGGPGVDPWQDEPETISEILSNAATRKMALEICAAAGFITTLTLSTLAEDVYANLIRLPNLAVGFNRLDLYADPHPLPAVGDEVGCCATYARVWRPQWSQEPNSVAAVNARARFAANYRMALAAIRPALKGE